MLNTFRSKLKVWSHIFLWPVIISFIAFYGWSFMGSPDANPNVAATVGETSISHQSVMEMRQRLSRYYRNVYQDNFDRFAKNLDFEQMAVDQLINDALLMTAAQDFGISASVDEIRNSVLSVPYFQKDGAFSNAIYNRALVSLNMDAAQYEQSVGRDIVLQKTRTMLGAVSPVTTDELNEAYIAQNVKIDCDYFMFRYNTDMNDIENTDEEIQAYYGANPDEFKIGDQIRVDYVMFDPKTLESEIKIYEEDIEDYFDLNYEDYKQAEQVKASHILFKVPSDAPEEAWAAALTKSEDVRKRVEAGENFADLAKELSEDTSASSGGDLGFFGKGRMVKPFETAVWDLEIGDISEPVKSQFGYHVIKKTDYKRETTKALEEVKDAIKTKLTGEETKVRAMDMAQEFYDEIDDATVLADLASEHSIQLLTSEYFVSGKPPRDFGFAKNLAVILTNLEPGEISIPVETFKGVFLFTYKDTQDAHVPALEEVRENVNRAVQKSKAIELARTRAETTLADLRNNGNWEDIATQYELKTETTGEFPRGKSIPRLGVDEDLVNELFEMNVGDITDVKNLRDNLVILKLKSQNKFDELDFQSKIPDLRKQLLSSRQNQLVTSWLDQRKAQMMRDGLLTISMTR